jgi:alcohol dehydrogenase class IV
MTMTAQFALRTTVHCAVGARALLPRMMKGLGGRRAVLFTDKGLTNAGITRMITELFQGEPEGIQLVGIFDESEQDAKAEVVNRGARFFRECQADTLIAVGGGSVLDTAKAVKWMLHKNLQDIREGLSGNTVEAWPEAQYIPIPHIALPTTAGTGSEVSPIAVVFHETIGIKTNLIHPFINADIALLDPELTIGLPPVITAFTGFDALTHAVEAYFSPHHHPMADAFALQAARMIVEHLETSVHDGGQINARAQMLMASTMAITAFSLTLHAIPVHNLAHAFGAKFGIPHGLANAVLLPAVMETLPSFYLPRIHGFAEALGIRPLEEASECFEKVVRFLKELRERVGLPDTFAEYSIPAYAQAQMVTAVQQDPAGVAYRLPDEIITEIFKRVAGSKAPSSTTN